MKKIAVVFYALIFSALSVFSAPSMAEFKKMKLRMGHFLPATFAQAEVDQWFADEVKKRTGGAVQVEIYWAGAMGNANELISLVGSGALDFGAFPLAYYPRQLPLTGVGSLPQVFSDIDQAHKLFPAIAKLPEVQAEHKKAGLAMLLSHQSNSYRIACNRPVDKLDQLAGYRVRSTGEYIPMMFRSVGMIPVSLPANEVYEGLERGNMHCTMLSYDQMYASKMYEVAKYASDINLGSVATWQIWASQRNMNRWPENLVKLLHEIAEEGMLLDKQIAKQNLDKGVEGLKERGVDFQSLDRIDDFNKTIPNMLDLWVEKMVQSGNGDAAQSITSFIRNDKK